MAWYHILSKRALEERHALTARLDPAFAAASRAFWEARTAIELSTIAAGAWYANDSDTYQLARSYLALKAS